MRNSRVIIVMAAALAVVAPLALMADHHETGPAYLTVHIDEVVPEHADDYEAIAKKWPEAFAEAGLGEEWTWYASSGNDFTYVNVSPLPNYAYIDGVEERRKQVMEAVGEEKMAELLEAGKYIRSHHTEIVKARPDLTYLPKDWEQVQATFMRVAIHHVKPSMNDQFQDLIKRAVAAFEKAEAPVGFEAYEVEFGEGSYVFTTGAKDAATYYGWPGTGEILTQAEGAEVSQAMFEEWRSCITDYETMDNRLRPDLSYIPAMMKSEGYEAGSSEEMVEGSTE